MTVATIPGVQILGAVPAEHASILSLEAQDFVAKLHRTFNTRRKQLLQRRAERQKDFDAGRCA